MHKYLILWFNSFITLLMGAIILNDKIAITPEYIKWICVIGCFIFGLIGFYYVVKNYYTEQKQLKLIGKGK